MLFEVGKPAPGCFVLLSGRVASAGAMRSAQYPHLERRGRGQFIGEVGQLSGADAIGGRPSRGPVEDCSPPERLRALLVAEVELGERISAPSPSPAVSLALGLWRPGSHWSAPDSRCGRSRNSLSAAAIRTRSSTRRSTAMPAGLVGAPTPRSDDLPLGCLPRRSGSQKPGGHRLGEVPERPAQLNPGTWL